jgi:flagellar basal-body rod modification protein FlgD
MATTGTSAINGVTATGNLGAATPPPTAQLNTSASPDFDRFLKLLTAQMKYQDPMQPTDPTQFVAQLAQFSQVEQQTKSNVLLQGISDALAGSGKLSENAALLGKTVQTTMKSIIVPPSGTVPLEVHVSGTDLANPRFEVLDEKGAVLRKVGLTAADTTLAFDGRDNNGNRIPPGSYSVRVVGDDASGSRQSAGSASSVGTIKEVRGDGNGSFTLVLNNGSIIKADEITRLAGT